MVSQYHSTNSMKPLKAYKPINRANRKGNWDYHICNINIPVRKKVTLVNVICKGTQWSAKAESETQEERTGRPAINSGS